MRHGRWKRRSSTSSVGLSDGGRIAEVAVGLDESAFDFPAVNEPDVEVFLRGFDSGGIAADGDDFAALCDEFGHVEFVVFLGEAEGIEEEGSFAWAAHDAAEGDSGRAFILPENIGSHLANDERDVPAGEGGVQILDELNVHSFAHA